MSKHRVIVVGAGMAGLSAAHHLVQSGLSDVIILEAQNRIGGRMHTVNFGQHSDDIAELGANWIHGASPENSLYHFANRHNLLNPQVFLERMSGRCYTSNGHVIDQHLVEATWEAFQKWEQELANLKLNIGETPLDYFHTRHKDALLDYKTHDRDSVKCIFDCLMNYAQFHDGGFLENSNSLTDGGYEEIPGGNIKVPCGMISILEELANVLPKNSIRLNTTVEGIQWGDGSGVCVYCMNGEKYEAEHVVVTISVGVLQQDMQTLFQPPLPSWKSKAIATIPMGKVNKILLFWEKPFWNNGSGGIKMCWSDEEAYVKSESEWYKRIYAFDEVLNNPNVLLAFISGDEAEFVEKLEDDEVLTTCGHLIRKFLNDPKVPNPQKCCRSYWIKNPFTLGSYSYCGKFTTLSSYENYIKHLPNDSEPSVLFAGEATLSTAYGTMHGARSSGLMAAEAILNRHGVKAVSHL